ncbi:hypothetical protein LOD99_6140 [Oopsacas minuta]|uniref:DNA replication complex GINS protein PSF2 n=1 Tax=Oopsacas minuta TaxID=111878 RepID=A0AAV7JN17_9METZ|nr:hypothetical protein LOD99_6140 [Oopsacas minuta]
MSDSPKITPADLDYLAMNEVIFILPGFSLGRITLILGDFGPFVPSIATKAPLWFALYLKERKLCQIQVPSWLTCEWLETKRNEERSDPDGPLHPIHLHYMEISSILLNHASDDIPQAEEIRTLIKDIWDMRMSKLRRSISIMIKEQHVHAQVKNISYMELFCIRPHLCNSLFLIDHIQKAS